MSIEINEMGPIDYLVVEFPNARFNGEGLPLLVDLVDRNIVRILDLMFVRKLPDGSVVRIDLGDRTGPEREQLALFDGASSGLFDQGDVDSVAAVIEPGNAAGVILYENRWAAPLAVALRRNGAQVVAGGRIPTQSIVAALDESEARSKTA